MQRRTDPIRVSNPGPTPLAGGFRLRPTAALPKQRAHAVFHRLFKRTHQTTCKRDAYTTTCKRDAYSTETSFNP